MEADIINVVLDCMFLSFYITCIGIAVLMTVCFIHMVVNSINKMMLTGKPVKRYKQGKPPYPEDLK